MEMLDLKEFLEEKGLTIGAVESFTGGQFAYLMTNIPGSSKVFKGSLVTYASEVKEYVLKIDSEIINKFGVVSHEVAYLMAKNGREILDVDVCVSFTGNAGPSAMENKPVGLIYLGVSTNKETKTYEFQLSGSRDEIRELGIKKSFSLIREVLA